MQRMQLILKKALDVSVHGASLVDLRACLEAECQEDEELLSAFFPPTAASQHQETEEVAAQAVLSLRQKVDTLFQWLCETHDVDAELLELENLIQQAEDRRLREVTASALDAASPPVEEEKEVDQTGGEEAKQADEPTEPEDASPEARIRVERLRAKEEEQQELQALVAQLEARNEQLQRVVEEKRRAATADVQRMQRAAEQLEKVSHLAKDYASAP
ncbi:hypothetical protein BBJ28_00008974 [Nothophytophthora sp. Chile5]|nr:hypothetical protein BBJ28_00008974 [Nothophytophthora sp. Chile5]